MGRAAYRDPWIKKAKWLTQALIISGTLNVALLSTFIYMATTETRGPLGGKKIPSQSPLDLREQLGLQQLLGKYCELSFQDLLLRLGNTDHIESGYTKRDLALAALVAFHHFNIERALGGVNLQQRELFFSDGEGQQPKAITVFPGLADYQYQAIVHYAKTEKWPLTAEGLFHQILTTRPPYDPSLLEAFYLSPEFHFVHLLFSKTGVNLKKESLVLLLAQGDWQILQEAGAELKMHAEFSDLQRRGFLLKLLASGSKIAAKILLEVDEEFCVKHLEDSQILSLCDLLQDRVNPSFLKELLLSPRSDAILQRAGALFYELAGESAPDPLDLAAAKERFIDLKAPPRPRVAALPAEPTKSGKIYKVCSGDSLWKIARDCHTTVKAIREENHLTSDVLKVGQELRVP